MFNCWLTCIWFLRIVGYDSANISKYLIYFLLFKFNSFKTICEQMIGHGLGAVIDGFNYCLISTVQGLFREYYQAIFYLKRSMSDLQLNPLHLYLTFSFIVLVK